MRMEMTNSAQRRQSATSNMPPAHERIQALLPSLTHREMEALKSLLEPVTTNAEAWCHRHPFISPKSVLPVSIVIIVQHPGLAPENISTVVKAVLWITAIDDSFDGNSLSGSELSAVTEECLRVACSPYVRPSSPIAACLKELRDDLSARTTWLAFQATWAAALTQVLDSSTYEYWMNRRFSGHADLSPPTFEEYFSFSRTSIGLTFLWLTGIIAEDKPELVPDLPDLLVFAGQCSHALRLANDLATYKRERTEGTLNSVFLHAVHLCREKPELTWQAAEAEALQMVERARDAALEQARVIVGARSAARDIKKRLLRGLELGTEIYALRDVREWEPESAPPTLRAYDAN